MPHLTPSSFLKTEAHRLGFSFCGIARAKRLDEDALRLEKWLRKGRQGNMAYMENHFDKRVDPRLLVEGAKSVITLLMNYYPEQQQPEGVPKISAYAYGKDYHIVIRDKLNVLLEALRDEIGEINGRCFVDSAPVLERSWAVQSGLGWIGKNGNLITKQQGSYFFIATLITDLDLEPDLPMLRDYCGTCTACLDACTTQAILPDKEIDGSRCISYFTIELKEAFTEHTPQWTDWMFGCDVCMQVCPWNRFAIPTQEPDFTPIPEVMQYSERDWLEITEETFRKVFHDSPLKRSKQKGILRNIVHIARETESE